MELALAANPGFQVLFKQRQEETQAYTLHPDNTPKQSLKKTGDERIFPLRLWTTTPPGASESDPPRRRQQWGSQSAGPPDPAAIAALIGRLRHTFVGRETSTKIIVFWTAMLFLALGQVGGL